MKYFAAVGLVCVSVLLFGCPRPTTGSVRVNLLPQEVVAAGARWNLDGGAWNASGSVLSSLTPGAYTIGFNAVEGWASPQPQQVQVVAGSSKVVTVQWQPAYEPGQTAVVLGYNDLGMHCMNQDFSEMMILPPYNTLHAQVISRGSEEPSIVTSGVTVSYSFADNTTSSGKTNFWDYAQSLFGTPLAADIGLTGNGLSGTLVPSGENDWVVTGIPITPLNDENVENAYPLADIVVTQGSVEIARTKAVVPVSWEISCNLCHNGSGISTATDILREHDERHDTNLESNKPVMCGSCHGQAPLGTSGSPSLSRAMHKSHASRMGGLNLASSCYACHPGVRTQCLRDVHFSAGMDCNDCHGSMTDVSSESRQPWVDEPKCGTCHTRSGFEFEQSGKLFRDSKGHHGVHCAACHGSPHAITPTVVAADNVQAIALQGHAGVIATCSVCHVEAPDESFDHRLDDDESDGDKTL